MKTRKVKWLFPGIAVFSGLIFINNVSGMQIDKLAVVAANDVQPVTGTTVGPDVPMGQSATGQPSLLPENAEVSKGDDVFGLQGGYFHPYVTLQGEYTDNLYNVDIDKKSTFITTLSPGIWFALPRKKVIPVSITPHNTSPGGLQMQPKDYEGTDRYQAYALGGLNFKYYSEETDLNTTNGIMEGMFRYNMRGGLSLQIVDRYTRDQDRFDVGSVTGQKEDKFKSNLALATADWKMTEKLRAKLDYSNFWLDYDDKIDAFKNRVDNGFDLYGYYLYSVKTSFFVDYKYVDVQYDSATKLDNKQNFIFGGIKWDTTEKLAFLGKAGLQKRNFDNNETALGHQKDSSNLALDVQTLYKFTEKTQLSFDMYRTNEETDSTVASGKTVLGATLGYKQKFTDKISASMDFTYEDANYAQLVDTKRDDARFALRPAAQYLFREWLMGEVSYIFEKRDSTDNLFDYQTNTVFANLKFAL